jgi:hypothetical protein
MILASIITRSFSTIFYTTCVTGYTFTVSVLMYTGRVRSMLTGTGTSMGLKMTLSTNYTSLF